MDTSETAGFPLEAIGDGVATVAPTGELVPQNEAMRQLVQKLTPRGDGVARLDDLVLDAVQRSQLAAGETVVCSAAGGVHALRVVATTAGRWLVASDRTAAERNVAMLLAQARSQALAAFAGTLVHDLANQLSAVLGLSDLLRSEVRDPADVRSLEDLQRGTRQGAVLVRALQRLLAQDPGHRVALSVASCLQDVMAMAGKEAQQRGMAVKVDLAADLPEVHAVPGEATQALLHGCLAVLDAEAGALEVAGTTVAEAIAGGRLRACVRVRMTGRRCAPDKAEAARRILAAQPGLLTELDRLPASGAGLAHALLAMRRVGGDLRCTGQGDLLELDYVWPAGRPAS